ncbi:MAG: Abortive infection protein [Myxococcales bacterium]|nr:Abortive infection protein [Myxococcales bacterium]
MTSPSPSEPLTPRLYHAAFAPVTAVKLAAVSIGTIWGIQTVLYLFGTLDLVSATLSDLVVIAMLLVFARRRGGLAALGLRRSSPRFVLAGILIGSSVWYIALRLVDWLRPPGDTQVLQNIVEQSALVPTLAAIAIMPAIAEELVFRGVLARGLATRLPAMLAIVLSTLLFCAFHLLPAQMVGVLPLALALGVLALRADSVIPTIIAHFINNVIGVLIARDGLPASVLGTINAYPNLLLLAAFGVAGVGLAIATRRTVSKPESPEPASPRP